MEQNILSKMILTTLLIAGTHVYGYTKSIKSQSNIKWKGMSTGISSKLRINGFYAKKETDDTSFLFYDDGTIVLCDMKEMWTLGLVKRPKDTSPFEMPSDTIVQKYQQIPSIGCWFEDQIHRWDIGTNGVFEIKGDTIYANLYWRNCFDFGLKRRIYLYTELYKLKFHIIDDTTMTLCEAHYMDKEYPYPQKLSDTLRFIPALSPLPPAQTEMKQKKWLWKDKQQWKKYREKMKLRSQRGRFH